MKTAMEWIQLPHWLLIAGTLLVIAGLIGRMMSRKHAKVQDPITEQSQEPRPQLPPLPDLLDSRPKESRQSVKGDPLK